MKMAILAPMKRVSVTELKNKLSKYLRLVKEGETVEIVERSVPIARLTRIPGVSDGESLLERLVRDGIVSPARRKPTRALIKDDPVPCRGDAVQALIEGRGDR
jgi:prevent-host-death family protein